MTTQQEAEHHRFRADACRPASERVRKVGSKWALRSAGSAQDFPVLFPTRRAAVAMAEHNAVVVHERLKAERAEGEASR